MNPERWQEVQKIYLGAVGLDEVARTSFLERICSGDPSLKQEVDSLLSFDNKMEGFLEETAVEVLAQMYGADKTAADTVVLDDFIGTVIDDRYVVSEFIGAGGMGDVYRADHRLMGTPVAIKRLASRFRDRQDYRQRFIDEARHAVLLDHENVTGIKDVVEQSGEVFVVMEFIDGQTLRTRLDHPFSVDEFLDIAIQCASALTAAHNERIVHLDIKPANIMLTGSQKVKVCDFGVARQLATTGEDGNNGSAARWKLAGTPAYMAPEVIQSNQFDARADVFSLGVVFYEMLAGKHPFRCEDLKATTSRIIRDNPPPVALSNRKLPRRLVRLLDQMLAKDQDQRIGSTAEVLRELQLVRLQHNFLRNTWRGFTASVQRRPLAWAAGALILVIALAGTAYFKPISIAFRHSLTRNVKAVQFYTEGRDLLNEYYKPENIDASIDLFDQALKLSSNYAEAYASLGEAYSIKYENTGDVKLLQSATNACLNSRSYGETLAEAHVCLGTVAHQRGKFEDAAAEFRLALKSDPNSDSAHRGLARALDSQGKFKEAKEHYLKGIEKNPNYWASHSWFGEFYNKREMFDDAIEQFELASALSPNNGRVYYSLGTPYFLNGKFDQAVKYFEKALDKQPYLTRAANNLGAAYFLMRSCDKAIPLLKEAVERNKGTKDYLEAGNLARAYFWCGKREDSVGLYKLAIDRANTHLEANPGKAEDHLAIALYNAMLSEETRAMTNLEIALRGHDQDAHSLETAAIIYVQFKKYETAFENLENARRLGLKSFKIKAVPEFDVLRVSDPKRYDKLLANK